LTIPCFNFVSEGHGFTGCAKDLFVSGTTLVGP
jgi:hypothetical protein